MCVLMMGMHVHLSGSLRVCSVTAAYLGPGELHHLSPPLPETFLSRLQKNKNTSTSPTELTEGGVSNRQAIVPLFCCSPLPVLLLLLFPHSLFPLPFPDSFIPPNYFLPRSSFLPHLSPETALLLLGCFPSASALVQFTLGVRALTLTLNQYPPPLLSLPSVVKVRTRLQAGGIIL